MKSIKTRVLRLNLLYMREISGGADVPATGEYDYDFTPGYPTEVHFRERPKREKSPDKVPLELFLDHADLTPEEKHRAIIRHRKSHV